MKDGGAAACRAMFVLMGFYWSINALLLIASVWGPGIYFEGDVPNWAQQAALYTRDVCLGVKCIMSCVLFILFLGGFTNAFKD